MRLTTSCSLKTVGLGFVLAAAMHTLAIAQESEEGERPRRSTRQPTFVDWPGLEQYRQASGIFRRRSQEGTEDNLSDQPTDSIAVTLWILTVGDVAQPPADELSAKLSERIDNLSTVIGSVNEVRKLVGQIKVAGLMRNATEFRLVTLNGQSAMVQNGKNQPRIVASTTSPAGRTNTVQYEPVGTIMEVRPRIDKEGSIQVSLKISESDLEKSPEILLAEPANGSPTFADVVTTQQFNAATSLKNDTAALLKSVASTGSEGHGGGETKLIILGATVVQASE